MGNRLENLSKAEDFISFSIGKIVKSSSIYLSEAWGFECQEEFYNQVIVADTKLSPIDVLSCIKQFESNMGRIKSLKQWESRVIDIDIMFYGSYIFFSDILKIPHVALSFRKFVLLPMQEIQGDFVHPILKKKIFDLVTQCPDQSKVVKLKK